MLKDFDYLDENSYIRLYKAIVRPQLEFSFPTYVDIGNIEAVWKRFMATW